MSATEHLVQFYGSDAELLNSAAPYLAEGLHAGEATLVIATSDHLEAFAAALAAEGFDLGDAGAYRALNAAEVLGRLRVGGCLSVDAFHRVIGDLVRERLASGRRLRIYGEIVALLWREGDTSGAFELEELWNDLGRHEPFELFCAYPAPESGAQLDAVRQLCAAHSRIVPAISTEGAPQATLLSAEFPPQIDSPGGVRRLLRSALRELDVSEDLIERGVLAATELAANAVLHARTPFRLLVQQRRSSVWIGVQDGAPLRRTDSVAGRWAHGLAIIATLALRWGVIPSEAGKLVWAELPH